MDNNEIDIKNLNTASTKSNNEIRSLSNPVGGAGEKSALTDYTQTLPRKGYDSDIAQIAEVARIMNNLAPFSMPEYCFNVEELNGERYYKPDGTLLLVRDFDSDVIRDYYYNPNSDDPCVNVFQILEHDKNTGRLRVKIEPVTRKGSRIKTTIAIFDEKISNKYTIIQLSENGIVNNISDFSGQGKSFKTLFRNIQTFKPVRYLEGKDNKENGFEMVDCIFSEEGDIVRIKRYNNKREININYTETQKQVTVKTKK